MFEHHSLSPTTTRNLEGPSKAVPGRSALKYILWNAPSTTQFRDIDARVSLSAGCAGKLPGGKCRPSNQGTSRLSGA